MVIGILLLVNLPMALIVSMDAHKREIDEGIVFVLVLAFGLIGVLVYLLARPDTIVPIDEREFGLLGSVLWILGLYIGAAIGGLVVSFILVGLSGEVAREIGISGSGGGILQTVYTILVLILASLAPIGLHFYRNPERVEQAQSLYSSINAD